jgi:hypothetical protein
MARRRKAKKCKIVRGRRLCWGAKGKIVSNTKVRRKRRKK